MQRFIDIILSGLALLVVLPLFVMVICILKITGEGEVFFLQKRIGINRNPFMVYKFATMLKNSENIGAGTLTMRNDPRVLPFGSLLRKTKINELPQLYNILIGDMSIIGPRPLVPEGEDHYPLHISSKIRSISPGVTGIGSLILRDEESYYAHRSDARDFYKDIIQPYKASLELWYIENKSVYLNIQILFFTIIAIVFSSFDPLKYFKNIPKIPKEMITSRSKAKD